MERDYSTSTILRRDDSGDHILLSRFRDRVSVPKHSPGNVSLLIENLEIPDNGHYTCQVIWRSKNNSLITKEVTTTVKVVKGNSSSKALLLYSQSNPQSVEEKQQQLGTAFHTMLGAEASPPALCQPFSTHGGVGWTGRGSSRHPSLDLLIGHLDPWCLRWHPDLGLVLCTSGFCSKWVLATSATSPFQASSACDRKNYLSARGTLSRAGLV